MNNESINQALRAAISLTVVMTIAYGLDIYQMIAPFSATCALLAALPAAPFSKPKTLVISHLLCIGVGVGMSFSPFSFFITLLAATWISIMLMASLKVVHAPAVAHTSILIIAKPPLIPFAAAVIFTSLVLAALSYLQSKSIRSATPLVKAS